MSDKLFYCMDCKSEIETPKNNCCPKCNHGGLLWIGSPDITPLRAWLGDSEEVERLHARIAELEAQWHDASEPPENKHTAYSRSVEVQHFAGDVSTSFYDYQRKSWDKRNVLRWRELPPMPERVDA